MCAPQLSFLTNKLKNDDIAMGDGRQEDGTYRETGSCLSGRTSRSPEGRGDQQTKDLGGTERHGGTPAGWRGPDC